MSEILVDFNQANEAYIIIKEGAIEARHKLTEDDKQMINTFIFEG